MAKKLKPKNEQPDLFSVDAKPTDAEAPKQARKIKIPTAEDVRALERRTGESPHKAYYWLLAELNK